MLHSRHLPASDCTVTAMNADCCTTLSMQSQLSVIAANAWQLNRAVPRACLVLPAANMTSTLLRAS